MQIYLGTVGESPSRYAFRNASYCVDGVRLVSWVDKKGLFTPVKYVMLK